MSVVNAAPIRAIARAVQDCPAPLPDDVKNHPPQLQLVLAL
ncbi:hypothetical protein [Chroococcidiopsis cubana]|nr:hypothetical protein [Chroococcidiopsis cubana]